MFKAVIFDLDGTLIDTLDDLCDSMNFVLSEFGFKIRTKEEIRSFVGNGLGVLAKRSLPENCDEDTVEKAVELLKNHYFLHSRIKTKPYNGIVEAIAELKKNSIKCVVLTNKLESAAKELCDDFFGNVFELVCGDNGKNKLKPAPDGIDCISQKTGVKKSEIIYVGDSEVDAQTAINAGVKSIGVVWGFRDEKDLCKCGFTYLAPDIHAMLDIIKKNS